MGKVRDSQRNQDETEWQLTSFVSNEHVHIYLVFSHVLSSVHPTWSLLLPINRCRNRIETEVVRMMIDLPQQILWRISWNSLCWVLETFLDTNHVCFHTCLPCPSLWPCCLFQLNRCRNRDETEWLPSNLYEQQTCTYFSIFIVFSYMLSSVHPTWSLLLFINRCRNRNETEEIKLGTCKHELLGNPDTLQTSLHPSRKLESSPCKPELIDTRAWAKSATLRGIKMRLNDSWRALWVTSMYIFILFSLTCFPVSIPLDPYCYL